MIDPQRKSLMSYAAACLSIYLQAYERGLELPLRDACMVLCEDDKTVMIDVPAGDDWIMASFELPERVNPETFDLEPYLEGFRDVVGAKPNLAQSADASSRSERS
jgi:hypothetical protein